MKKNILKLILIILVIGILFVLYSRFFSTHLTPSLEETPEPAVITSGATPEILAEIKTYKYTQTYSNTVFRFSFQHPEGFTVTNAPGTVNLGVSPPSNEEMVLLVQSGDKKVGIQIVISPYGEDIDITTEIIHADLPNITIGDPQPLEIGENRLGLAFMSDSQVFGGKSREVWFVWKKNLYQISTYAEYDEFLKGLFGTWTFF